MSAKIKVQCPKCGKRSRAAAEFIGRKAKCACGNVFVIQAPTDTASPKKQNSSHPMLKSCEVNRTILGQYSVDYQCPHCGSKICSAEKEVAGLDRCPNCHGVFGFAADVLQSLRLRQEQDRQSREERKILKDTRREERRQKSEEKQREKQRLKQEKERLRESVEQERKQKRQEQMSGGVVMAAASALNDPINSQAATELISGADACWYCQCDKGNLIHQCSYCGMI